MATDVIMPALGMAQAILKERNASSFERGFACRRIHQGAIQDPPGRLKALCGIEFVGDQGVTGRRDADTELESMPAIA